MKLNDKMDKLSGVGKKKKEIFLKSGIETIKDLLMFYPRAFEDRRKTTKICDLIPGNTALIEATVLSSKGGSRGIRDKAPFYLNVSDETGILKIVFFHSYFNSKSFFKGQKVVLYGKVTDGLNGDIQMTHPEVIKPGSTDDIRSVIPVYPAIEGISQKEMRKYQLQANELCDEIKEILPEKIRTENKLADINFTFRNLHFPKRGRDYLMAKYRMIFDEFLTMETGLLLMKKSVSTDKKRLPYETTDINEFITRLPFELTEGQRSAWNDISNDLMSLKPMNRLIQGDVGSGKTVIAEMAMYAAYKNGYQSVMMAPTELLSKQHYESLKDVFDRFNINTALLCSNMKASEKRETLENLSNGNIDILIGTHAVIEPGVVFKKLGMVITDEQHRFGVNQRNLLNKKGSNPDIMVMTATPIPRTLAVVLYGDSDVSQIRTMPEGRKSIKTIAGNKKNRNKIYEFVKGELNKGHQAYVVAPLIEESDKINALSAEELYKELKDKYKNYNVGLVHGSMKQDEKDTIMESFVTGSIDVLVSTVVIEVGINVPNATVMVIESSERFGLAQMHQLRGRVGRGNEQSYCFLISYSDNSVSSERNKILCNSTDGFEIAEEDLKLRGPGEIFGTRQHGLPELIFGDVVRHYDVLEKTRDTAIKIIDEDPTLSSSDYQGLKDRVIKMFGENISLNL